MAMIKKVIIISIEYMEKLKPLETGEEKWCSS